MQSLYHIRGQGLSKHEINHTLASTSTVQNESENKIKQLTEADSDLVDENRQIDFQIEDILQMVKNDERT